MSDRRFGTETGLSTFASVAANVGTVFLILCALHVSVDAQIPTSETVRIPSGTAVMFGSAFAGDGSGPRPTVVMLPGAPAWSVVAPRVGARENILELAQPLQRAGFNVLVFNYRGSWGSSGTYGLISQLEDTKAALAFVTSPGMVKYNVDQKRIIVLGHSLGGWNALITSIEEPSVTCTVAIAPAEVGQRAVRNIQRDDNPPGLDDAIFGLSGYTPRDTRREILANQPRIDVLQRINLLKGRPLLIVQAKQDSPNNAEGIASYVKAASETGLNPFAHMQVNANHTFTLDGNRNELASMVVGWMGKHCK